LEERSECRDQRKEGKKERRKEGKKEGRKRSGSAEGRRLLAGVSHGTTSSPFLDLCSLVPDLSGSIRGGVAARAIRAGICNAGARGTVGRGVVGRAVVRSVGRSNVTQKSPHLERTQTATFFVLGVRRQHGYGSRERRRKRRPVGAGQRSFRRRIKTARSVLRLFLLVEGPHVFLPSG